MAAAKEVESLKSYVKQLQSSIQAHKYEDAASVLKLLKSVTATEELLRATKAGVAVSKVRTCEDVAVSQLAKETVTKWKAEVDEAKKKRGSKPPADSTATASPSPAGTPANEPAGASGSSAKPHVKVSTSAAPPASYKSPTIKTPGSVVSPQERKGSIDGTKSYDPNAPMEPRSRAKDGVKILSLNDKVRDKCVEMIYDALVFDSGAPSEQVLSRAHAVEKSCHKEFGSTANDYRTKIRRLVLNLKDKQNPSLRQAIVSGDLEVERFCKMSNQEMQSEERKQANGLLEAQNLHSALAAGEQEAETDAFQCGRCKQRKTRYRQAQTRSADEPMTTFVTCVNCGNRWKFS